VLLSFHLGYLRRNSRRLTAGGHLTGGGVPAHHDFGVAALLEIRIEDRFSGRAPCLRYLGESAIIQKFIG
jgi:hypothetical protein